MTIDASDNTPQNHPPRDTLLRQLPAVDALVEKVRRRTSPKATPSSLITQACRTIIEQQRQHILDGKTDVAISLEQLGELATQHLHELNRPVLSSVINATGILLHTGLGRSPLARQTVDALADVAGHYAPVELDMTSGKRNRRADVVRGLLCELTGSESATVVNNNAAATLLTLAAVAAEKEVIVSRGELVEIGGSFRLPDVMQIGRATLREVGTTNRTRVSDYAEAITDNTGAILKVHPSNFRIMGFTEAASLEELIKLGHEHNLPVIDDIGSGALHPMEKYGLIDEPVASDSIRTGADLVLFSADKLLGGPQAGIIVGTQRWIDRIEKHPLYRAFRVDKLTFAALGRTLQIHRDIEEVERKIPLYRMLVRSMDELHQTGQSLKQRLDGHMGEATLDIVKTDAFIGGGSTPAQAMASVALCLEPKDASEQTWADHLRGAKTPVLARVAQGKVWFDLRSVMPDQIDALADSIMDIASIMR